MSYNIIPLLIVVFSLAGIVFIILRKFPVLASIDIDSIKSEREAKQKEKIIASRLERKIDNFKKIFFSFLIPIISKIKKRFKSSYNKFAAWEDRHSQEKISKKETPEERKKKIGQMFFLAKELIEKQQFDEAEKKFVEIISLDHRNVDAYRELGHLYVQKKDYDYAIETLRHVLKLKPRDVEIMIDLGTLLKNRGENKKALRFFKKAVELEPTKPKSLDFLIDISIIVGDRDLARETLGRLKEVNPENNKIGEFEERIKEIK